MPITAESPQEADQRDPGSNTDHSVKAGTTEEEGGVTAGGASEERKGQALEEREAVDEQEEDEGESWTEDWWYPSEEAGERPQLGEAAAEPFILGLLGKTFPGSNAH